MQKFRLIFSIIILTIGSHSIALAQTDTTAAPKDSLDYYDMSLDQLLKIKSHGVATELEKLINTLISVASKKPLNTRESPSIVSLITEEEIKKSGARDLIDVLRLVPGFDFGVDVEGVVGIGIRGNWSHEGKVLVLIDGQEMNEILFASTTFGNHYPIDQIKRIEIIRGPGSAIYGGYAEYGVINIITRQGGDINGLIASAVYGQMDKTYARRNVNISIGQKIKDFQYSVSGLIGQGNRSDQNLKDIYGQSYNMAGNSGLNPRFINVGLAYKGLSLRCMGDFFQTSIGLRYTHVNAKGSYIENFNSLYSELKYVIKINDKFTITPKLNFKQQTPWQTNIKDSISEPPAYNVTAYRGTANLTGSFNLNRYINLVAGGEIWKDYAIQNFDTTYFSDGKKTATYFNYAFFTQGLIKTRLVNIILGARYDKHNAYGDAFVPRVGLTKKYNRFHFKALYSQAFRAPTIENIHYQGTSNIHPERTEIIELELGYQITRKSLFTINVYDITTAKPIIYYVDTALHNDAYINFGKSGTQGIEAEYRLKGSWGYFTLNYSYYSAANKPKVDKYAVANNSSALLGFANHKVNLTSSFNITKNLSFNPSVSIYGPRWGYVPSDSVGISALKQFDPTALINFFIRYNTPLKGLTFGLGVYDILNQKFHFIQPYNSDHPPLPGPSREIVFRLSYTLNYKTKTVN